MDAVVRRLIEALHQAPFRCVLAVTGGGAQAAALLLNVPGASRTVLEVLVPYDENSLIDFLGRRPEQFCCAETSRAMAARARERARRLAPGQDVIGVGCTASLATDRPKRGDHRLFIGIQTEQRTTTISLILHKGARDREGEEAVLDTLLLNALAEAVQVAERLPVPLLPGEQVESETHANTDPLSAFFNGQLPALCVEPDGRMNPSAARPGVVVPGSFHPVHAGHWELAAVAAKVVGRPAAFELSIVNVDKPSLTAEELRRRLIPFGWMRPVWLTRTPRFEEKAELFPGAVFAVGADTALRIVQLRYYGDSEERMVRALTRVRDAGCRILVAGRRVADGRFLALEDIAVPEAVRDLFTAVPRAEFHIDISSTELRHGQG